MQSIRYLLAASLLTTIAAPLAHAPLAHADDTPGKAAAMEKSKTPLLQPTESRSDGSVTIAGKRIDYQAVAGTLIVHPKGWDDQETAADQQADTAIKKSAQASMFYVAYFKKNAAAEHRPVTFLYNGGPGSSSVWLHMGAFGPRRVSMADAVHPEGAPYALVNNDESLLDVSDLVFIDAPGTGFSRVVGHDKDKAFYGIDQDANAFSNFIAAFLSKYGRWNSPKFLFGESYGTTRSAVLANDLEADQSIDLNGVILLSQILAFDNSIDGPERNPGTDLPYVLALPTYAATAWYHHKLDASKTDLPALLSEVEHFATTDYAEALGAGDTLAPARRDAVAGKLHDYTGLPVDYIKKSDLRINGGQFEKMLQGDSGTTTGRLDSRFSGPSMDPLSKESDYDPQSAAISSAYVATFNDYVRGTLHYGEGMDYKAVTRIGRQWDMKHQPAGADRPSRGAANVMVDLASAMKYDPKLKVMLNAGYFDLATPFYEGLYEMHHLPIPAQLAGNIEYKQYRSGHMVYANPPALKQLHDNVVAFIRRNDNQATPSSSQPSN